MGREYLSKLLKGKPAFSPIHFIIGTIWHLSFFPFWGIFKEIHILVLILKIVKDPRENYLMPWEPDLVFGIAAWKWDGKYHLRTRNWKCNTQMNRFQMFENEGLYYGREPHQISKLSLVSLCLHTKDNIYKIYNSSHQIINFSINNFPYIECNLLTTTLASLWIHSNEQSTSA